MFAKVANEALADGKSEEYAIRVGLSIVAQEENKKKKLAKAALDLQKKTKAEELANYKPPAHLAALLEAVELKKQQLLEQQQQEPLVNLAQATVDCLVDITVQGEYCNLIYSSGKQKKIKLADFNIEQHVVVANPQRYFEAVTAFNGIEPEIVFTSDGDIVMQEVSPDSYL